MSAEIEGIRWNANAWRSQKATLNETLEHVSGIHEFFKRLKMSECDSARNFKTLLWKPWNLIWKPWQKTWKPWKLLGKKE